MTTNGNEPLVALWAEQNRLVASCNATDTDPEIDARGDELSAIEHQIANTEAKTLAGVLVQIKLRESVLGDDHWILSADLTRNVVKALERMGGCVVTEPDPVVTLFAKWGILQDVAGAIIKADPEANEPIDSETDKLWNAALDRRDVVGDKIMSTPATSIQGVAVKIRLASHYAHDIANLAPLYATPSRDIDYFGLEGGAGGALNDWIVSALRDAERLAGAS